MPITVTDVEGNAATIADNALDAERIVLRFQNGKVVDIETSLLMRQSESHYLMPYMVMADSAPQSADHSVDTPHTGSSDSDNAEVLTLAEERVFVEKRERTSETVRISKAVVENVVRIEEDLHHETISVEHKPINTYVEQPGKVRYEGDTTIIPIYEEVVVVEKRWMLREEIHVTKQSGTRPFQQDVVVRREQVQIDRQDHADPSDHDDRHDQSER